MSRVDWMRGWIRGRNAEHLFGRLVVTYRCTCAACPTQYEGTLRDGRRFYFRYRGGRAALGVGATVDEAAGDPREVGVDHGDSLDGNLDEDEFRVLFVRLAEARGLRPVWGS